MKNRKLIRRIFLLISIFCLLIIIWFLFIRKPYYFPTPGSREWESLENIDARMQACQLPTDLLRKMSTDDLLWCILHHPFVDDLITYSGTHPNSPMTAYEFFRQEFNGVTEFENRPDSIETLLDYLAKTDEQKEEYAYLVTIANEVIYTSPYSTPSDFETYQTLLEGKET